MSKSALVTVREFQLKDETAVKTIFATGMMGLAGQIWTDAYSLWTFPAASVGTAAITFGLCKLTDSSILTTTLATLASAAALPAVFRLYVNKIMADYVNASLSDDLKDIQTFYSEKGAGPGSVFLVACMTSAEGREEVVGHVGLERKSDTEAELRRMSVRPGIRRAGIGSRLCKALIDHARGAGFKRVFLATSSAQQPAMKLYKGQGWVEEKVAKHLYGVVGIHYLGLKL
eukprot:CAMPEP_0202914536 /NCGR_PEP_ID=MMETSP1392-20130828/63295_1 /ASSEMBLY_ACC=CAM_ASM_000868 /TAXON_ID=225041 /ORGANISM="Chlamydomonas chlamydogama, Strain SAG 11-48b" /LENGTH=229 /DNA_ID=CAMNT_0049606209 /DNA_START=155 /DNA_END=844 /DNA_ORIENTATION=+